VASGLLACGGAPEPEPAPLRIGLHADPGSLDPHLQNEMVAYSVLSNVYESLVRFDANMSLRPLLAEGWVNPDDFSWRLLLRKDVRFHDGRPLTAEDVAFSLERARSLPGTRASALLVGVEEIRVQDEYTVDIVTRHPHPILLNKLASVFIVPDRSLNEIRHPVGTGPYKFVSRSGQKVDLRANTDYWGEPPSEKRVEIHFVPDREQRVIRLLAGQLDLVIRLAPEDRTTIEAARGMKMASRPSLMVAFLQASPHTPPFDDRRVRRAIHLALDRQALVRDFLLGEGIVAAQMVSPGLFGFAPDLAPVTPDPARARELLAEAGHPQGIRITLEHRTGLHLDRLQSLLREQLALGEITLDLQASPWSELYERITSRQAAFFLSGWVVTTGDSSDVLNAMAHTPDPDRGWGDTNVSGYSNPELDRLIERCDETLNIDERRELLQRAMRQFMDDLVLIPLYVQNDLYGVREDLVFTPRQDSRLLAQEIRRMPPEQP
jgi:peptide/nickel transport system substrate-binding protein